MKNTYYSITFEKLPDFKILGKPLNRRGSYIKDQQEQKRFSLPLTITGIQTQTMRCHLPSFGIATIRRKSQVLGRMQRNWNPCIP